MSQRFGVNSQETIIDKSAQLRCLGGKCLENIAKLLQTEVNNGLIELINKIIVS